MAVTVTCQFTLPLPPTTVWAALKNVSDVAGCFPGVSGVEPIDDRSCKGVVIVRLGPMQLEFSGQFAYALLDDAARHAEANAQGQDKRGRGRAQSKIRLDVAPDGAGSVTTVSAETELSGAVAQFGRAQNVIQAVAKTLIGEFAKNLEAKLAPEVGAAGDAGSPAWAPAAAPEAAPANGLAMLLRAIGQWFKGLFGRAG